MLLVRSNARQIALKVQRRAMKYPLLARNIIREELVAAEGLALKYSGLTDHSLKDLREMGYPYARRNNLTSIIKSRPGRMGAGYRLPLAGSMGGGGGGRLGQTLSATLNPTMRIPLRSALGVGGVIDRFLGFGSAHGGASRSGGGPPHEAYWIHIQSGLFHDSWQKGEVRKSGGSYYGRLTNNAPYARYLEGGTQFMIARPILKQIAKDVTAQHRQVYRRAYYQIMGR